MSSEYNIANIKKNDNISKLIIDDLEPKICINLTNKLYGNKFFDRKVYVDSIVQKSPTKNVVSFEVDDIQELSDSESSGDENDTISYPTLKIIIIQKYHRTILLQGRADLGGKKK